MAGAAADLEVEVLERRPPRRDLGQPRARRAQAGHDGRNGGEGLDLETRLHPGRVAPDPEVERALDSEASRGGNDRATRVASEAVQLRRVLEVVASGEPVVQRGLGRDHTAPAPDLATVGTRGVKAKDL